MSITPHFVPNWRTTELFRRPEVNKCGAPVESATCGATRTALESVTHKNCETVIVKNITVSVDDETYRRSRIKAAEAGTSVSALVKSFLVGLAQGRVPDTEFEGLARQQQEVLARIRREHPDFSAAERLSRDALHDRDALR